MRRMLSDCEEHGGLEEFGDHSHRPLAQLPILPRRCARGSEASAGCAVKVGRLAAIDTLGWSWVLGRTGADHHRATRIPSLSSS